LPNNGKLIRDIRAGLGRQVLEGYGADMEVPAVPPVAHRVAMYDMDRTITRAGTYSGFLMHVARRRQPWRLMLLPLVGLGR